MTHLSSRRKSTNRTSYSTLTVLTLPSSLQWRTTRRMVPSPSWTPLLNQRLMGDCLLLYTGNLPTQAKIYSGTAASTYQQNSVINTFTIGPKQCVAILSFSTKKWITSGRHSSNANTLNGLWTRWKKGLTGLPGRLLMGLTIRTLQVPSPPPMKLKPRVILLYFIHKVSMKALRRSLGSMAYRPTSKVVAPSKTYWSPPRTKPHGQQKWGHILKTKSIHKYSNTQAQDCSGNYNTNINNTNNHSNIHMVVP